MADILNPGGPIDYGTQAGLQNFNPTEAFNGGLQAGNNLNTVERANTAYDQAAQAMATYRANPTADNAVQLAMYIPPEQSKAIQASVNARTTDQQLADVKSLGEVSSALKNGWKTGDYSQAYDVLENQAKVFRNSGNEQAAKNVEATMNSIDIGHPEFALAHVDTMLTFLPRGKEVLDNIDTQQKTEFAAREEPGKIAETEARTANAESETVNRPLVTAETQRHNVATETSKEDKAAANQQAAYDRAVIQQRQGRQKAEQKDEKANGSDDAVISAAKDSLDRINKITSNREAFNAVYGGWDTMTPTLFPQASNTKKEVEGYIENSVLANPKKLPGSMSDRDVKLVRTANSADITTSQNQDIAWQHFQEHKKAAEDLLQAAETRKQERQTRLDKAYPEPTAPSSGSTHTSSIQNPSTEKIAGTPELHDIMRRHLPTEKPVPAPENLNAPVVKPYAQKDINRIGALVNKPSEYDPIFQEAAKANGMDWKELKFRSVVESGLNPEASSGQANGIMQFSPATATRLGIDPLDPKQAIPAAAKILAGYGAIPGGDLTTADLKYYGGENTRQWGKNTHQYAANLAAARSQIFRKKA